MIYSDLVFGGLRVKIQRVDRPAHLFKSELAVVRTRYTDTVAFHNVASDRKKTGSIMKAGLQQYILFAGGLDTHTAKHAQVKRFMMTFDDHNLNSAGIQYRRTAHEDLHPGHTGGFQHRV